MQRFRQVGAGVGCVDLFAGDRVPGQRQAQVLIVITTAEDDLGGQTERLVGGVDGAGEQGGGGGKDYGIQPGHGTLSWGRPVGYRAVVDVAQGGTAGGGP